MDVQQGLLSKIIHDGAILQAVNDRVTPEFFTDDRYHRVFQFLLDHWRRFGVPADLDVVSSAFPSYTWPVFAQSYDYFVDALRQRRKRALATEALGEAVGLLQAVDDPDSLDDLFEVLQTVNIRMRLETTPTLDYDFTDRWEHIEALLKERSENPGYLRGISTGFRGIDLVTGGWQPQQFIVMIGLPKALKSSTLLWMAMQCHAQYKTPLFLGFEMANQEQEDRLLSLYGHVGLTKVMNGTYGMVEEQRIRDAHKMLKGLKPFILSSDTDSAMTVSGLQAKIQQFNPDVLFVDGAYMMRSELPKAEPGSPQALTDIAQGLKRLAQNAGISIVVTTQASAARARGGKLNMFSAMWTQSWGQSADVLLGVERVDTSPDGTIDDTGEVMIKTKVLASRAGPRAECTIVWDWSKGSVYEL